MRHTTFRYQIDASPETEALLRRHGGASRFAFNQCLRLHLNARRAAGERLVPWTGFDLINAFNAWKRTEAAGRMFTVAPNGYAEVVVTGLRWRGEVCQQVFEEAAVDCGRALGAWTASRRGKRRGRRVGHPRFKRKTDTSGSFRIRNKTSAKSGRSAIRVGDTEPRSVTLPGLGAVRVVDDTRPLGS
ncbi:MAG: helix-turn-helix domain-containing protein [Solirubrobacteraceae bacterium]